MNSTNVLSVNLWKDGTRKGMGANLFFFAIAMFIACMLLGAFGHPVPVGQGIDANSLQILIGVAATMVAAGAMSDKKHAREMKKLDIEAAKLAPANATPAPAV